MEQSELNRRFEHAIESWNTKMELFVHNVSQMPDHGLYALWMQERLNELTSMYNRIAVMHELGAKQTTKNLSGKP